MPTLRGHFSFGEKETMVFNGLKKLFGADDKANEPDNRLDQAAAPAPSPDSQPPEENSDAALPAGVSAFLRREPVFGKDGRIAGHLFRLEQSTVLADVEPLRQRALDAILLDMLHASPSTRNAGLAFVPINSASIHLPVLDKLNPAGIVLMLQLSDGTEAATLCPRMSELRARGLRVGLFRQPRHPAFTEAMRLSDCAGIDVSANDGTVVRDFSIAVRTSSSAGLLACNIETADDFRFCRQWHFDFCQGPFVLAPKRIEKGADPHKAQLLNLLRMVQGDAETAEIVEGLKQDPMLSFRILRYLNSPVLGLSHHIDSLSQALTILGRQRLSRWLSMMLFSAHDPELTDWLLVEKSLTRGRLMEHFGGLSQSGKPADALFLTGIFSCLDRLLHRPLADILADIPVNEEIRDALVNQSGPYAPLLDLVCASEGFDDAEIARTAAAVGIPDGEVNSALLEALSWASEVTGYWD
jgi:EAL and modified HD-GYP domain-containing signal transduction protein